MRAAPSTSSKPRRALVAGMPKVIPEDVKDRIRELVLDESNTGADIVALLAEDGVKVSQPTVSLIATELDAGPGRGRAGREHATHEKWSPLRQHVLDARAALPKAGPQALANWIWEHRKVHMSRQHVSQLLDE